MANPVWQGRALAVAQVTTLTIGGTVAAGNTVSVTINRKTATATAVGGDTTATLAYSLYKAIQALVTSGVAPEFAEVSWLDPSIAGTNVFTGTSVTAGVPFTLSVAATGGGATISQAATTAATGPNDLSNVNNWDTGALPTTSDNITFPPGCPPALYNIDALAAVDLGTVTILGGTIGFTDRTGTNATDPNSYYQYRNVYFKIKSATNVYIGDGTNVPDFCRLQIQGTTATPIRVMNGSTLSTTNSIQLSAVAGTSHSVTINGRSVGIAPTIGETMDLSSLRIGTDGPSGSFGASNIEPTVTIGSGVTSITAARLYGGTVTSNASFTALTIINGTWVQDEGTPGTVTAITSAGTYEYSGTASHGVITATGKGVVIDFSNDSRGFTLASGSAITEGAALYNPQRCNCSSLTIDKESMAVSQLGETITLSLTAA